jgi:hypothetical protein
MDNSKVVMSCVKISGEQWAPQVERSMAGEAMRIALTERRRGLIEVSRRSDTGVTYISIFEVYDSPQS